MAKDRIFEITIKYKSIEWSFSCSPSDYKGHSSSRFANFPHYHFQMKINDKVFIKFADFHPPLSDEDLFFFEAHKAYPKKVKTEYLFGEGMDFVLSKDNIEKIFNNMKTSNNEETATFNVQTIVEPPNGKTFSGNEISELMKESKKTGVPLSKLFRKLHGKMTSFVSPGKGVPEIKKRKRRRRK